MTEFLKQAFKEARSMENKALFSHLKRTYMSKRQIGKCKAIYRAIPALNLQGSNITCTFVASGYPENQAKFLKKVKETRTGEIPPSKASNEGNFESSSDANESQYDERENNLDTNKTENQTSNTQKRDGLITKKSKYFSNNYLKF